MRWTATFRSFTPSGPGLQGAASLPVTLSLFVILDRTEVFGDFKFNEPEEYQGFTGRR
jgi:hypothetical protein